MHVSQDIYHDVSNEPFIKLSSYESTFRRAAAAWEARGASESYHMVQCAIFICYYKHRGNAEDVRVINILQITCVFFSDRCLTFGSWEGYRFHHWIWLNTLETRKAIPSLLSGIENVGLSSHVEIPKPTSESADRSLRFQVYMPAYISDTSNGCVWRNKPLKFWWSLA
jgi:hypothetical protein